MSRVYRDGPWSLVRSFVVKTQSGGRGGAAQDIQFGGRYDGDGKADLTIYRGGT
jgi:hypothetical protein